VLNLLTEALNDSGTSIRNARILVLGVAYKRGVGDTRESPAVEIVVDLVKRGGLVRYADPFVPSLAVPGQTLTATPLSADLLRWSDAVLILTDHREFDYSLVVSEAPLVVDTRNATAGLTTTQGRIVRL
jgi:UDP-N-acetyl-D-glucosamine dehydrogenase